MDAIGRPRPRRRRPCDSASAEPCPDLPAVGGAPTHLDVTAAAPIVPVATAAARPSLYRRPLPTAPSRRRSRRPSSVPKAAAPSLSRPVALPPLHRGGRRPSTAMAWSARAEAAPRRRRRSSPGSAHPHRRSSTGEERHQPRRRRLLCLSLARHRGRVASTEGMPGNQLAIALARQLQWPFSPSSLRFANPWFCKVSQRAMQCHSRNSASACRFSIHLDLFC